MGFAVFLAAMRFSHTKGKAPIATLDSIRETGRALQRLINACSTGDSVISSRCMACGKWSAFRDLFPTCGVVDGDPVFVAGRSKRCARSDVPNGGVDLLGGRFGSEVWCIRSHEWRCTVLNLGRLGRHFKHYA